MYLQIENCLLHSKVAYFNALQNFQGRTASQRTTGIQKYHVQEAKNNVIAVWKPPVRKLLEHCIKSQWPKKKVLKKLSKNRRDVERATQTVKESILLWESERGWL